MSGVDVLAVMDKFANVVLPTKLWDGTNPYCNRPGYEQSEYAHDLGGLVKARAVVAELIEAIKPIAALDLRPDGFDKRDDSQPVYARGKTVITVGDVRRASAALARCRGGAA